MIGTLEEASMFAARWAAAWNRRDIEAVLEPFEEDVVFTSPTALAVTGVRTVHGKEALRTYWSAALAGIRSLRFIVDRVVWDPQNRELAIIYTSEIDGSTKRVSENLTFNRAGRAMTAEVFHGVTGRP